MQCVGCRVFCKFVCWFWCCVVCFAYATTGWLQLCFFCLSCCSLRFAVLSDSCIVGGGTLPIPTSVSSGCVERYCEVSSPGCCDQVQRLYHSALSPNRPQCIAYFNVLAQRITNRIGIGISMLSCFPWKLFSTIHSKHANWGGRCLIGGTSGFCQCPIFSWFERMLEPDSRAPHLRHPLNSNTHQILQVAKHYQVSNL